MSMVPKRYSLPQWLTLAANILMIAALYWRGMLSQSVGRFTAFCGACTILFTLLNYRRR